MKSLPIVLALLFSAKLLTAQVGISVAYKPIDAPSWEYIIAQHQVYEPTQSQTTALNEGIHFGVDYWFRLKNYRVEFLPELSITRFTRIWEKEGKNDKLNSNFIGIHFNTNIYPFDLKGDCDCPTFSKEGPDIAKGFFIQISPGYNFIHNSYKEDDLTLTDNDFVPSVGLGVGVDIGLSDFLTVTPMVKFQKYFNAEWEDFNTYFATNQPISDSFNVNDIDQIFAGIRIGFRFDELR